MLGIVKEINGQKTIIPLTTDTGTGAPVGTLIQQYKKKPMSGYLYCDGSTFDENAYPALYMYLGSNILPDYRECVMVGAEQNTTDTIATHDVYGEGEFKDDQMQRITGSFEVPNRNRAPNTSGAFSVSPSPTEWFAISNERTLPSLVSFDSSTTARSGDTDTTHGKQKAVYVYIKATSGLAENQQDNVLNNVKDYVDNSNSYSTQEVKTGGTWIDGKPIYRNVLINTALINGGEIGWGGLESKIASLNIDNCLRCFAITINDGSRYLQFMPNQGGFISYYSGISNGSKIIMEYTKTTD